MSGAMRRALELHAANVTAFLATAEAVAPARWDEPVAAGKWTPAEIAAHLVATYEVVLRELRGGEGMRIVLPRWQQLLAMLLVGWRMVWFGTFPKAARAPRETRPPAGLPQREALAQIRLLGDEFALAAAAAPAGAMVTHAYFGRGPAARGVVVVARHMEHHRQQMEG